MTQPGWLKAASIIGIVMACLSIFSTVKLLMLPFMEEIEAEAVQAYRLETEGTLEGSRSAYENGEIDVTPEQMKDYYDAFESFVRLPGWFASLIVLTATLEALACIGIIIACVKMLGMQKSGVILFFWTAGAKTTLLVANLVAAAFSFSVWAFFLAGGGVIGIIVYGVLLIIVGTRYKAAFLSLPAAAQPASPDSAL